jgi:hypothetical protein
MGEGKTGGPYALFVHHSGQKYSVDNMLGSSVRFAVSQRLSCPPNKAWRESISTLRLKGIQGTILRGGLLNLPALFVLTTFHIF